ncbi:MULTISPECIES: ribosomal protein S18-alanine N-acetyltransferase [Clostridium]|jgi:[ribosomal protein S18]-alanine N-acetyltransferase|uniref:[Ribosomal protein bS18]-alanine N-acetyltransferase n=1 Tax=Clostridium sartagoforme AAU1 TaxID=1202534 RepID=R9BWE3_9CLOT|nr:MULTISPECIES: ribosomal protein S18-alanine N-acetyltransferase [Clostridium]EOR21343.1 ribosomal-protein-alanine acetyltransferase [Clostridium sartagoforme AAU1]KLE16997.1 30S ribosomal protein S18 [Clostridium sp. C8]
MRISCSLMTANDINDVLNISNLCFSTPWSRDSIYSELNNPLAKYIVAKDLESNSVIGFIGAWIVMGEADITNIAVHPNYRNLTIGSKLLSSLISLCENLDCSLINLEVRSSNIPAQNLYKKFLFIENGLRKGYYTDNKEDAVLMTYFYNKKQA